MARVLSVANSGRTAAWMAWVVVLGLFIASLMLWKLTRDREDQRLFDQKDLRAEALRNALQDRLAAVDEPLYWNEQGFAAVGRMERRRFEAFNRSVLERIPSILMLEWTPRVWLRERDTWLSFARTELGLAFDILEPDNRGMLQPTARRADYYLPVLYSVTRPGVDSALGFNVGYSEDRRDWYETSARNASRITTGVIPIFVSRKDASRPGFVHSRPIYAGPVTDDPESRWERLVGWMSAVVTLEELFAESVDRQLTPEFDVFIYEIGSGGRLLLGERSLSRAKRVSVPAQKFDPEPSDVVKTLEVGARAWGVVLRPTSQWRAAASNAESTRVLLISLVFTGFIGFNLWRQGIQRQRAEALQRRVAAREALLHDVTNGVPVVVYQSRTIADGEPRVTFVSDQVKAVLGVSQADVLADADNFYRHIDQSATPRRAATETARADDSAQEYCLQLGGQRRWVEHRAVLRNPDGPGARVTTGYWADITELKLREGQLTRAKEQAEQSRQELQAVVHELERTRGALVQSEKLASLGSMVAGVSHELNTPLGNALLASTGLQHALQETHQRFVAGELKKSKLERFFQESLVAGELIARSVERAGALVAGFKQTAIDQTDQERRRFDLVDHLQRVVGAAQLRHTPSPCRMVLSGPADVAMDSFPRPLEQVLAALIDNSVQHGFAGRDHGTVSITYQLLDATSGQDGWVEIVVSDDGCGIAPEIASRVFDPLFTTRMGRHVGMGLNVAHRMTTTVLGGNIVLVPDTPHGASFALHLPLEAPHII